MKIYLIIGVIVFAVSLAGCVKMVKSYTTFSIPEFDDFINTISDEGKEKYIGDGNLDHAKIDDVVIVPFIKETNHEECALFIYAYSTNKDNAVCLESVILSSAEGVILYKDELPNKTIEMTPMTDTMTSGVYIGKFFKIDDAWYYNGSELKVELQVLVENAGKNNEKVLSYDVTLIENWRPLCPT